MEQTKKTRGGRREGAGRKRKDNKTVTIAFSISQELVTKIAELTNKQEISRSKLIVEALKAYINRSL